MSRPLRLLAASLAAAVVAPVAAAQFYKGKDVWTAVTIGIRACRTICATRRRSGGAPSSGCTPSRSGGWWRRSGGSATAYALARKAGDDHAPPEIKPVILEGPPVPEP
jgi:hypothetical protein